MEYLCIPSFDFQYVGGTANTVPFENAPGAVVKARALIQKRVQEALGKHIEFNEILRYVVAKLIYSNSSTTS